MATTTNFSVRMDSDIKKQCEAMYGELGINLTTAINVFLRQSLRVGGFPFDVRMEQPNKETMAAMLEAERIARDPSVKRYSDVEEVLRALKERFIWKIRKCTRYKCRVHFSFRRNEKAPAIFKLKTASALQFHILFFLLRGFLLRRKDFADPIANILHRLQFLLSVGKLCVGRLQLAVFRFHRI